MVVNNNRENLDKIKDIIEKSGHNFHYQVVKLLKDKGWTVQVSPYYRDNITDKSREIDIIGEKSYDIAKYGNRDPIGTLTVKLFIECKRIEKEWLFWFDQKNEEKTIQKLKTDFSLPNNYDFSKSQYHYYTTEKVAKLFDCGPKRKENEEIFKAINQCLHGMIYYRPKVSLSSTNNKYICFPLIVVDSFENFYRIDPPSEDYTKITEPFLIEINYAYVDENRKSINEYFLIDVVEYKELIKFVETGDSEHNIKNDISHLLNDYKYNDLSNLCQPNEKK